MQTQLSQLALRTRYLTTEIDPVLEFYKPCMASASHYDRAVGYFRSSVYLIVGLEVVSFAKAGGKIRLVCSPSLSAQDIAAISSGYMARCDAIANDLYREIDDLLFSDETSYRTRILATLIAVGSLEIRIAFRPQSVGLYHEKIGLFRDKHDNAVSFLGSANETWNGWHERGNHEAIEVFSTWTAPSDAERVSNHREYFERLWHGNVAGLEVIDFPLVAKERLIKARLKNLDMVDGRLMDSQTSKRSPLPHQLDAIEAWKRAGNRGVFEHATGSGKTFLALTAIKEHTSHGLPALILVPSALLLKQWALEASEVIPEATLFLAGAGNDKWKSGRRLASMSDSNAALGPRVIISTMQTAATVEFSSKLSQGSHLMIVADEVHQIGSPFNARSMSLETGPRLALSATPDRYGDKEGTSAIFEYFGDLILPKITLEDAIRSGRLVEYKYYPHAVHLTAEESDQWKDFTKKISLEVARSPEGDGGSKALSARAKMLLIQRSRIAKKASRKIELAREIICKNYEAGQRWLVYCEDIDQLQDVLSSLADGGIQGVEYHTSMEGDSVAALEWFRTSGGVLVSIKCLDEGVDIPSADHALILASSQNPRQFVQRRGRVLRKSQNKYLAAVHDAIVVPLSLDEEPEQTALLKSELLRAIEFAKSAINRSADAELRSIAINAGYDPDTTMEVGIEEE